jgi:probable F420-dependent oxidoreductase
MPASIPKPMKVGVAIPAEAIGSDIGKIREFVIAAEEMGLNHVVMADHVLGADPAYHEGWKRAYTNATFSHEPFTLFSYLAGATTRIEFVTGILILPQRQTALVAKQAAELDLISGGRFQLGIGVGWNAVEYEGLNEDFHTRGARSAEQIEVLRALWTQDSIDFEGKWHHIHGAGINPKPVQQPIPVWVAGASQAAIRRAAEIGDGWISSPMESDMTKHEAMVDQLKSYASEFDRDMETLGIDGRLSLMTGDVESQIQDAKAWADLGATRLTVALSSKQTPQEGLSQLQQITKAL